jgi:hypothetical protein
LAKWRAFTWQTIPAKNGRKAIVCKAKAVKLFDAHPELQRDMRKIATDFLWSLTFFRPDRTDPDLPEFLGGPER